MGGRECVRPPESIHARATTSAAAASDGSRHFRRGVESVWGARRTRGVEGVNGSDVSTGDVLQRRTVCACVCVHALHPLHVASGSRFRDVGHTKRERREGSRVPPRCLLNDVGVWLSGRGGSNARPRDTSHTPVARKISAIRRPSSFVWWDGRRVCSVTWVN